MPKSREVYILTGHDLEAIKTQLNAYLQRLSDRLDKLEGLRGELETESGTFAGNITAQASAILVNDENDALIHSLR